MEKDLIAEKLEEHDKRLDKHEDKIEILERNDAISNIKIDNLCKSLDSLCSKIQWQNGFTLTGLVMLAVYIVEKALFKA